MGQTKPYPTVRAKKTRSLSDIDSRDPLSETSDLCIGVTP
jgi:hypothetical protein